MGCLLKINKAWISCILCYIICTGGALMEHMKEWLILWAVLCISFALLFYCLYKKPLTEWLLVFFSKAYISSLLDNYFVVSGNFSYPVRFLPTKFDTSLVFDYLAFPVLCVLYNQTSHKSKLTGIIGQAILYSCLITLIEWWIESNTLLIDYRHWNLFYSLGFFILTFLLVRGLLGLVRKVNKHRKENST
jgi:hypothetical protein